MVVKHFPPRGKTMVKHFGVKSGNIPKYPVKQTPFKTSEYPHKQREWPYIHTATLPLSCDSVGIRWEVWGLAYLWGFEYYDIHGG